MKQARLSPRPSRLNPSSVVSRWDVDRFVGGVGSTSPQVKAAIARHDEDKATQEERQHLMRRITSARSAMQPLTPKPNCLSRIAVHNGDSHRAAHQVQHGSKRAPLLLNWLRNSRHRLYLRKERQINMSQ